MCPLGGVEDIENNLLYVYMMIARMPIMQSSSPTTPGQVDVSINAYFGSHIILTNVDVSLMLIKHNLVKFVL